MNNNIYGNNNRTVTPQPNNMMSGNPQINGTINNQNMQSVNTNNMSINPQAPKPISQNNPNIPLVGIQNNPNIQMNNQPNRINPMPINQNNSFNNIGSQMPQVGNYTKQINSNMPKSNNNSQMNDGINTQPVNPISNMRPEEPTQNISANTNIDDEELLRAYIGKNYEKITTKSFNIAAFFFTTLYMCYRKMFIYGLLLFIGYLAISITLSIITQNIIITMIISIALNIIIGLFFNKIYLSHVKKKIAIIKANDPQKSNEELKTLCTKKGGTSGFQLFWGILAQIAVIIIAIILIMIIGVGSKVESEIEKLFNFGNFNISENNGNNFSKENSILIEDVSLEGYSCLNSKCNVTIATSDGSQEDYQLGISNTELFNKLGNYNDNINLNIYYVENGDNKVIVDYKIYKMTNKKDISNVSTESELRETLGLYSIGIHTATLTLKEIGTTGFGYKDDTSYEYTSYTFFNTDSNEYEMNHINNSEVLNLIEGEQYTVTFEVSEGVFDYEYTIIKVD